jgi:hypothetical protein
VAKQNGPRKNFDHGKTRLAFMGHGRRVFQDSVTRWFRYEKVTPKIIPFLLTKLIIRNSKNRPPQQQQQQQESEWFFEKSVADRDPTTSPPLVKTMKHTRILSID